MEITAPGGDTVPIPADGVLSTLNTGATVPAADAVAFYQGTSMAAPHVSGVVSLMLAVKPNLMPGQALEALQQTARPFPNGSSCDPGICGPGIVDAFGALTFVSNALNAPTLISPADGASVLTDTVELDWSAVAGADGYRLHIASDPAFSVNLMEIDVAGHAYSAGPLVNGNYYWRVQALDNGAPGFLSETRLFNIAVPPPCLTPGVPSLSSPATKVPSGISSRSRTSPVVGSMRRSSLASFSQVPCQRSPSTHVTPVTKRSDSMVFLISPVSGSIAKIFRSLY